MPVFEYKIRLDNGTPVTVDLFFHHRDRALPELQIEHEGRMYRGVKQFPLAAKMSEQWGVAAGTRGLNKKTSNRKKPMRKLVTIPK